MRLRPRRNDPNTFGTAVQAPIAPQPPASATPLEDYRAARPPGVSIDGDYAVLPWRLVETMPLAWQQEYRALLAELHRQHPRAPWPGYRVVPVTRTPVEDLTIHEQTEAAVIQEIDDAGELVYRDRITGARLAPTDLRLVTCRDPLTGH
jgi:hypothetical protein